MEERKSGFREKVLYISLVAYLRGGSRARAKVEASSLEP